jgi:hypothetical protein
MKQHPQAERKTPIHRERQVVLIDMDFCHKDGRYIKYHQGMRTIT